MADFDKLTLRDMDTLRYQRATRFANGIQALLREFLPRDRDCARAIYDHLLRTAYEGNLEILNVPPEHDELTKLQLERKMIEALATPPTLIVPADSTSRPPAA